MKTLFVLCQHVLRATCEEMFVICFCEHCKIKHVKGLKTNVITDEQRKIFDVELNNFRYKWKDRFINEQCLERSFSEWVVTLLNHVNSIIFLLHMIVEITMLV